MTDELARLTCQSCDQPKRQLTRVESKLAPWPLNLCADCITHRYEPRWLIILAVRKYGRNDQIDKYIRNKLYVGEDIPAVDIL